MDERRKRRVRKVELAPSELVIEWGDGRCTRHDLAELRRTCPCALCRETHGRPDPSSQELPLLTGEAATATSQARSVELVGRYGLRINWADGHNHGIYSLEKLASAGRA